MSSVSKPRVRHNRHKQGLNLTLEKLSADFRFNLKNNVPVAEDYLADVEQYEKDVLSKR